jgi:hypothetical protein
VKRASLFLVLVVALLASAVVVSFVMRDDVDIPDAKDVKERFGYEFDEAATHAPSVGDPSSSPSSDVPDRTTLLRRVDWPNAIVPASICGGTGSVALHDESALVSSSRWPDAWQGPTPSVLPSQVQVYFYPPVRYGDVDGDGYEEAVVPIWCHNGGGTAGGQLGQGLAVFRGGQTDLVVLGTITTTQQSDGHSPYFGNSKTRIARGRIVVTELWYGPRDGTCCPSGRARTVWTYDGATLVAGRPKITAEPEA